MTHDGEGVGVYASKEDAAREAIRINQADEDHPTLLLYEISRESSATNTGIIYSKCRYIGQLRREFGHDFDPKDCWKNLGPVG